MKYLGTVTTSADLAPRSYIDGSDATVAPWGYSGTLAVKTGTFRWYNDTGRPLTIIAVRAAVGTAPTGVSVIVDVKKNGTSIFATTTANRPTIAVSTNTALAGTPDTATVAVAEYLTVDILQVGSTVAGADLSVTVVLL